jgi:hypothetical protein
MEVSGQCHTLAALHPWERTPCTHWIGGWVGLRGGLDTVARGKILHTAGNQTPAIQSLVRCICKITCYVY